MKKITNKLRITQYKSDDINKISCKIINNNIDFILPPSTKGYPWIALCRSEQLVFLNHIVY